MVCAVSEGTPQGCMCWCGVVVAVGVFRSSRARGGGSAGANVVRDDRYQGFCAVLICVGLVNMLRWPHQLPPPPAAAPATKWQL